MASAQLFLPFLSPRRKEPRGPYLEPSEGVEIDADPSEQVSGVPVLLRIAGASVEMKRLPCGDYLVGHRFLVERKHAGDFAKSLYDGRLFRQLRYLRRSAPAPLLVVEGKTALFERFWPPALRSALLSVATDFRVPVLFTRRPEGTAALLLALGRRCLKRRTGEYYVPCRRKRIFGRKARRPDEDRGP
ncbi:ERCC4 domain-containing protein [Elusimicrobiota bacterium]